MTNEEAIKRLEDARCSPYMKEAINIGIAAIKELMEIKKHEERTQTHECESKLHETHEERTADFESKEYVEKRLENYNKLLRSGILDCVKDSITGSTTDCISREAAIQAVTHFDDPLKRLYELPSVNPAKWIPCKERMPKDYEEVLVYSRIDDGIYVMYHIARDEWWESNDGEGFCFDDHYIAAWQPLPEPYKEKKE